MTSFLPPGPAGAVVVAALALVVLIAAGVVAGAVISWRERQHPAELPGRKTPARQAR